MVRLQSLNVLLLLTLPTTLLALPSLPLNQQQQEPLRPAPTPLHTTALLAGAAARPTPASRPREARIRDLKTVTGEAGLWINLEDLRRMEEEGGYDGVDEEEDYAVKVREKGVQVREREGWGVGDGEI